MNSRLPSYFKQAIPVGKKFFNVRNKLKQGKHATVCEQAQCPNRTDCWARGSLAFQIMGEICTRQCGFCAETNGQPLPVDLQEPTSLAETAVQLKLKHVVITSPARDDLPDQGAGHFAACIRALRRQDALIAIETLIPDFQAKPDLLQIVFSEKPDILNHNLETVKRITPHVRSAATYEKSLFVLETASKAGLLTKSGLMVGLGETREELFEVFRDLQRCGVKQVTVGQYLTPHQKCLPVQRFYAPQEFDSIHQEIQGMFQHVTAGPLVRSSYFPSGQNT